MGDYVLTLLAAAAVTYLLTPLVRRFATAIGASHAARDRDVHKVPTPLLGGLAMYAGLAAGLLVASQLPGLKSAFADTNMAKGLLMAGGLLVIMGFVDDRWGMSALSKLAGQVAAGVILVWSGAGVTWLPMPGGGRLGLSPDQTTAVTILLVVVTINAVNFIDGLDGLAAGVVGIGAASFFIYYYTLTHRLDLLDQTAPALGSAVLAGICLGFLPHNFNPAKIFMGDTGSMLIGLLLAYTPISSLAMLDPGLLTGHGAYAGGAPNRFGAILPLLLPGAIMLIPYADLLLAVVRRTRAGMSPFAPDKKHLHHRLLDNGHSHRNTVLIMYLWSALFSGSVVWLSLVETPLPVLIGVTVGGVLALLLVSMPRLRPWARGPEPALADGADRKGREGAPARRGRRARGRRAAAVTGHASRERAPADDAAASGGAGGGAQSGAAPAGGPGGRGAVAPGSVDLPPDSGGVRFTPLIPSAQPGTEDPAAPNGRGPMAPDPLRSRRPAAGDHTGSPAPGWAVHPSSAADGWAVRPPSRHAAPLPSAETGSAAAWRDASPQPGMRTETDATSGVIPPSAGEPSARPGARRGGEQPSRPVPSPPRDPLPRNGSGSPPWQPAAPPPPWPPAP